MEIRSYTWQKHLQKPRMLMLMLIKAAFGSEQLLNSLMCWDTCCSVHDHGIKMTMRLSQSSELSWFSCSIAAIIQLLQPFLLLFLLSYHPVCLITWLTLLIPLSPLFFSLLSPTFLPTHPNILHRRRCWWQDEKYWNRRVKNNEAAKRSRDARRLKENQISVRAAFLERENAALRQEVADMRKELGRCRNIINKYESRHGDLWGGGGRRRRRRKGREGKRRWEKGTRQPNNSSTLVEVARGKAGVDLQ